jgi:hypothetical protein
MFQNFKIKILPKKLLITIMTTLNQNDTNWTYSPKT